MSGSAWAAADKVIQIGLNFSLTGGDAESAQRMRDGALMAIDEANAKGTVKGYKLTGDGAGRRHGDGRAVRPGGRRRQTPASSSPTRRSSPPWGPQMSGAGKAMSPILSAGGLAIITPSSTNPDLTDPKFAAQYRPAGKAVYFRTVTTDAYQGPEHGRFHGREAEA